VAGILYRLLSNQKAFKYDPAFTVQLERLDRVTYPGVTKGSHFFLQTGVTLGNTDTRSEGRCEHSLENEVSFNFVSCYKNDDIVSCMGYLRPFDKIVWASVWATFFVTIAIVRRIGYESWSDSTLIAIGIVFEQAFLRDRNNTTKRCLSMLLLLSWLLLINAYKGKVTTNITAPLQADNVKTVEEAIEKGYQGLMRLEDSFTEQDLYNA